jgi:hypothetical protein
MVFIHSGPKMFGLFISSNHFAFPNLGSSYHHGRSCRLGDLERALILDDGFGGLFDGLWSDPVLGNFFCRRYVTIVILNSYQRLILAQT